MDKYLKKLGFKNMQEFNSMTCEADISTAEKMGRFKHWQFEDGSKEGLLKVIERNK